jgi:hypothetical protein
MIRMRIMQCNAMQRPEFNVKPLPAKSRLVDPVTHSQLIRRMIHE